MSERRYTVAEIDALRQAVAIRRIFGTTKFTPGIRILGTQSPESHTSAVEEIVRTHMLAGHIASDLCEADVEALEGKL